MKILITTDWYAPSVNGVVTSVLNLKEKLEEQGHQVRVLTLAQNKGESWRQQGRRERNVWYLPSVGAGRIYPGARVVWGAGRRFVREMIAWKPDVVHSQCEFTTFWFAAKIAKAAGAPLLHTYHTVYEDYTHYFSPNRAFGKKAAAVFSRLVLGRVDGVIVPTDKVKRLLEGYGVRQPIWTVPSGIDCARFRKARRERKERPAGASLRLLFLGRLAREKNLEELLIWMAGSRGKNYHLLVVGDGPHRPELEALAGRLGLYGRVEFAGMVPPEQTAFWYQKGDVFVCASRSETQGLTYLEALAAGLPAVCRADDCLEGVIENGRNGWQYQSRSQFFEALEKLEDPALYHRMSGQALLAASRFDSGRFGERILAVYQKSCGASRALSYAGREGTV